MFRSAAALIGFSVAMAADDDTSINVNNVNAQYYIGTFNGNEFPLAVGLCNPLDILAQGGSQLAECTDENTLTWSYYSDSGCGTFVYSVEFNSSWQEGTGTLNDFNCDDDADTAYAEIEFEAFGCGDGVKVTMNAAIGVCAFTSADEVSIQVYCESSFAELYYFDTEGGDSADCEVEDLYSVANATSDECDFMLKTSGIKVYGQVMDCVGWGSTTTTQMGDDTDNANNYAFTFLSFGLTAIFATLKFN